MSEKDYSLDALNRFFDFAANKGLLKRNTAQSRKLAANKVLAVLDDHEKNDLRDVDINHAFELFQNKQGTEYKPDSLQVYLSRVRTAVTDFVSYVDNPSGYRPSTAQRSSSGKTKRESTGSSKVKGSQDDEKFEDGEPPQEDRTTQGVIVPIPLRNDLTVKISNLPPDLTAAEAARLAAIIKAYAVIKEE